MKRIFTSIALAGLLVTGAFATDAKTNQVNKNAVINAEKKAQKNNQLITEAIDAIRNTQDALIYLNGKETKKAKESLKKAIGDLTDVLNRPNPPYLLPVDLNIEAYQFVGDISTIKKAVLQAKILVEENKLPEAREILNNLRDEIVINTTNLPLATYPAALKLAIKYINEGKIKDAKDVLNMALSTLVQINTIIPIPLVKAQALITQASRIVHKDPKQALKYLDEAKHQLTLAEALGYTSKSATTYKMLKKSIKHIENEIKAHHKTSTLFERLIEKIKEFKEKAITHTTK